MKVVRLENSRTKFGHFSLTKYYAMTTYHNCTIILPVNYLGENDCKFREFLNLTLLDLQVDCHRIGLKDYPVKIEYFSVPEQPIFDIINAYIGAPLITYDDELFHYLDYNFNIPDTFAYSWIKFESTLCVEEEDWEKEYDEEHEFFELYSIERYSHQYGLIDGKEFGMGSIINSPAKQYFCEKLYNLICSLIIASNIVDPGIWESRCAIVSTTDLIDDEYYGLSNSQTHFLDGIYSEYIVSSSNSGEKFKWPEFPILSFHDIWKWVKTIPGFIDGSLSNSNVGRALNAFSYNFKPLHQGEKLLYNIMALEALYSSGRGGIGAQLRNNIPRYVDTQKLLNGNESDVIIRKLYDQRSRYIHGSKNLPNPFRPMIYPVEDVENFDVELWEAKTYAFLILVETLRKLANSNSDTLAF